MSEIDSHPYQIKPVEQKDVQQFNELLSYVFQITDADIEEGGYKNEREMMNSKRPILEVAEVFGWFNKDQLISQIAIYPCEVNIQGTIYKMGGVTGVGTYPEYAGQGLMQELIHLALEKMRQDQQWISYLFPYNIPYYRRKGWEIMSDKLTFKIRDTQLPKAVELPGNVERHPVDYKDVLNVYENFSQKNHGALQRTAFHWDEYWRFENKEEHTAAIYYDGNGNPQGVLFYWIAEEIFHVKEMFYLTNEARLGLWNFITAHFSMVYWIQGNIYKDEPIAFLLEESQIKEQIEPYFMARIVDVAAFLENYPFKPFKKPFHFVVSDPVADWNNGIFAVEYQDNHVKVTPGKEIGDAVTLDIQTLTSLLMNYRRAHYLSVIERIHTTDEAIQTLERMIPDNPAYFSDYF